MQPLVPFVDAFAEAIARREGFYVAGSVASRFKNPGNLRWWPNVQVGSTNSGQHYALFPSLDLGWKALKTQIRTNIGRGLTFLEFFAGVRDKDGKPILGKYSGYAPEADNNASKPYAYFVVNRLNEQFNESWTINTIIRDVING